MIRTAGLTRRIIMMTRDMMMLCRIIAAAGILRLGPGVHGTATGRPGLKFQSLIMTQSRASRPQAARAASGAVRQAAVSSLCH